MEGRIDEFKGRTKEAAGDLTDNERLQREGEADQARGKVKQTLDDIEDKAEDLVDRTRDRR